MQQVSESEATVESTDEQAVEATDATVEQTVDETNEASAPDADEVAETAEAEARPIPADLQPNDIVDGNVAKLVDFGAFVDIPTQAGVQTGLVHVSEVAPGFVENIYAELGEGDTVTVKVLTVGDDGKIGLSIKQADPNWEEMAELDRPMRSKIDKDFDRRLRKFMHGSQSIQGEVRRQKRNKLGR